MEIGSVIESLHTVVSQVKPLFPSLSEKLESFETGLPTIAEVSEKPLSEARVTLLRVIYQGLRSALRVSRTLKPNLSFHGDALHRLLGVAFERPDSFELSELFSHGSARVLWKEEFEPTVLFHIRPGMHASYNAHCVVAADC